ncbi:ABC transporter substrate-binding protein [Actinokineospora enzanensis]|uniref:ABC transporter substrate-binding protein n=1 Tax=Actinokineospora enzanensis TaxID=155975 RepID=UPI000684A0D9|nr:ABC transporter substrate-binding protein [Actinokineospora enzanensis]
MRSRTIVVPVLAASLFLAGCGGAQSGDQTLTPLRADDYLGAPCPDVGLRPDGDKEFTYWSMWTADEPQGRVLSKVVRCFTDKTGVKVNVQWLGRDLLAQNVLPALSTGTVPDLFDQDITQVRAAVDAGGTQPVDDVLDIKTGEGEQKVRDVVPAGYYDIPQNKNADGKLAQVPYLLLGGAWWYDKGAAGRAALPKTTDDLFALFDKARADGHGAIALDGDVESANAAFFTQFALRYVGAGNLYKAATDRTGQIWRDDPGLQRAADLVEKLAQGSYLISGWDVAKSPQMQQRWAKGDATYLYGSTAIPVETGAYLAKQGDGKSMDFGSFQLPQPDGATHRVVEQLPVGFAVPAKAKNPGAAKAFIAYALNKDNLSGLPAVADSLTVRADLPVPNVLDDVNGALSDPNLERALFLDGVNSIAGGEWVSKVLYPLNDSLLKGNISSSQFIEGLAKGSAEFWRTH